VASLDVISPAVNAWHELRAVAGAVARYRQHLTHDDGDRNAPPDPPRTGSTWTNAPVVLVHGIGHNSSAWINLADRLRAAGFSNIHVVGYGLGADVPSIATTIERVVSHALRMSGEPRVHVVAHSLGGVAVRYWHDEFDGESRADAIVSLGAPHGGTPWARLILLSRRARDLASGSALLGARNDYRRWTTIGGSLDVVVPASSSHLQTSQRFDFSGIGHAGLLTSPAVGGMVCAALLEAENQRAARAESPGQTLAATSDRTGSAAVRNEQASGVRTDHVGRGGQSLEPVNSGKAGLFVHLNPDRSIL
jgi:triacylglycerol lipase